LQRVKNEQKVVEEAVADLEQAQKDIDSDLASKLRQGGLPKQMALVGLVLFSVRAVADSVGATTQPELLTGALLQGAIALACAAFLFLI
jgi:hypothetical protein